MANKVKWLTYSQLEELLCLIDRLHYIDPLIRSRLKKSLVHFISNLEKCDPGHIKKLIQFASELTSNSNFKLYLSRIGAKGNDSVIFHRLFDCISAGKMNINAMTCPDYSGSFIEEHGKPLWNFDFKRLGTDDGIVAQRAYKFIGEFYRIGSRYIPDISLRHIGASFEFILANGFASSEQTLTFSDCEEALRKSLSHIESEYRRYNISATTSLSTDWISSEDFVRKMQAYKKQIIDEYIENPEWNSYVESIAKERRHLLSQWHPQHPLETSDEYTERLKRDIIPTQLAQYFVIGEFMTKDPLSVALLSDSPIMFETHTFAKNPVFFGKSSGSLDYKES
jgi:hypothetical protein